MPRRRKSELIINAQHRERVVELKASGLSHKAIATVMGLPLSVLEREFSVELEHAVALAEAQLLKVRWEQARNGNQKALKAIEQRTAKAEREARAAKAANPFTRLQGKPGIDRPLSAREQNIFAHWCHRGTDWASLIPHPVGEEPQWSVEYRTWLKEQRGDVTVQRPL